MNISNDDRRLFAKSAKSVILPSLFSRPVHLFAGREVDVPDTAEAKWVQIATEGDFPGYDDGERPFALTRETFEEIIANLHRNPSYTAGSDGVGIVDVIPWDFHHASELYPADGSIPAYGAPAQAWTRELEIRAGEDETAQLWGLTSFLDIARGYVKAGQYKWASLAVTLNMTDPSTNENIGAVLTSVALTNQPVIQGMEALVASRNKGLPSSPVTIAASRMWFEAAENATEAMTSLKELFGLSEMSGAAEVMVELTKLQQWIAQNIVPLGVDAGGLIGKMRTIFNLPALSTEDEVIVEAGKVITRLIDEQAANNNLPTEPVAPVEPQASVVQTAAAAKETIDMEILKTLASKLGVRESDAEVQAAVDDLIELRAGATSALSADKDTTKVILEAAESAKTGRDKLVALVTALGVENPEEAVNRVAELIQQSNELKAAMPELENLKAIVAKQEDEQAEVDVTEVMNSRSLPSEMKEALLLYRKSEPEKFSKAYPRPAPGENALMQSMVVTPNGVELRPQLSRQGAQPAIPEVVALGADAIHLASYPGRNDTERAMSYVRSQPGADQWTHEQIFVAACSLKTQPNVVCSS